MSITDAEKYKDVPVYQQVCNSTAIAYLHNYGSSLYIRPTADKSLHTFMIKPDGRPFSLYKPSGYLLIIPVLAFLIIGGMIILEPKPLYVGLAIVPYLFSAWAVILFAGTSARRGKPIVTVDKQGITLDTRLYLWSNITNTFILRRQRGYEKKYAEFYLVIALSNKQTVIQRINSPAAMRDEVSELATTISYFRNNRSSSCPS